MDKTFGEMVGFIDCETDGNGSSVIPMDFMFFDGGARGLS